MNAVALRLEVSHHTTYDYASAVSLAQHQAHLQPLVDVDQQAAQQLESFVLDIQPAPTFRRESADAFGNAQVHFSLVQPHQQLAVRATSVVQVRPRFAALDAGGGPRCAELAARLRYRAGAAFEPAVEFCFPSPYVPVFEPALAPLADWAATSLHPHRPVAEAALELMQRLHAQWAYQSHSTAVDTPLAQAFAQRRGVCQDFAHLLIGALRGAGLPARYVSGYLLTHSPEGGAAMLGADASHAWAQVWCPGTPGVESDWLDLDPTNNCVPAAGHVRVALGRDFGDVTPLRGVIRGGGHHRLSVGVSTRVLPAGDEPACRLQDG